MKEEYYALDECPCNSCNDRDNCDGWEAIFCCDLCKWRGMEDCDNCDPFDI